MKTPIIHHSAIALGCCSLAAYTALTELSWASGASPMLSTDSAFLGWLLETSENQDGNENPRTKRGDDDFCLVTLAAGTVNPLWSDRPVFIMHGEPRSLVLYQDGVEEPIWEHAANVAAAVIYDGPPLKPESIYTLRAPHPQFPSTNYEQRRLMPLRFEDESQTTMELLELEGERRQAGDSEAEIALAKADYFWQQGLETDA